jgi:hypothetical protein
MFRAKRQGIELSINAIIVMALALIVLAVGAFLIIRSAGTAYDATNCEKQGGDCVALASSCPDEKPIISSNSCPEESEPKCCMDIGGIGQK